jgi:hypothetical protein
VRMSKLQRGANVKVYRISAVLSVLLASTCAEVASATCDPNALIDPGRLARNYADVVVGKNKRIDQLPEVDMCELLGLLTAMGERRNPPRISAACNGSTSKAERTASDVVKFSKRFSACIEGGRLLDDCSTEFYRLRSAQSDYETSVAQRRIDCRI